MPRARTRIRRSIRSCRCTTIVEALLDQAITDLAGAGPGPGANDFVYGGDVAKWTAAANTLKARYHMHMVEVRGNAEYQKAIDAATNGIATHAGDFRTLHTSATFERNVWFQFQASSGFGDDLSAGMTLVNIMNAQSDPRRAQYFNTNSAGNYGGVGTNGSTSPGGASQLKGTRNDAAFRQPLVTSDENSLILAEANFVLHGAAAAQPFLDQERASNGLSPLTATLASIMTEKYIALFQNVEMWADYKRTCLPALVPVQTAVFNNQIPGRFFYGRSEENTNPEHADLLRAAAARWRRRERRRHQRLPQSQRPEPLPGVVTTGQHLTARERAARQIHRRAARFTSAVAPPPPRCRSRALR